MLLALTLLWKHCLKTRCSTTHEIEIFVGAVSQRSLTPEKVIVSYIDARLGCIYCWFRPKQIIISSLYFWCELLPNVTNAVDSCLWTRSQKFSNIAAGTRETPSGVAITTTLKLFVGLFWMLKWMTLLGIFCKVSFTRVVTSCYQAHVSNIDDHMPIWVAPMLLKMPLMLKPLCCLNA